MSLPARPAPPTATAAVLDLDHLRSRSVLIYIRSSPVLSLLLYTMIVALLYSDLYVHLIRQTRNAFQHLRVYPGALFIVAVAGAVGLAVRVKPWLEKTALVLLALNLASLYLRQRMVAHSGAYLALCTISLTLDLALLATVITFYRKYPNLLKLLRQKLLE